MQGFSIQLGKGFTAGAVRDLLVDFSHNSRNTVHTPRKPERTFIYIDDLFQSQQNPISWAARETVVPVLELFRELVDSNGFIDRNREWCGLLVRSFRIFTSSLYILVYHKRKYR